MVDGEAPKETEVKEAEAPAQDSDTGNIPEAAPLIDRALQTAERLEAANKKTEELIRRQEQIVAKQMLAGKSQHIPEAPKTSEQMAQEEAERLVKKFYR